MQPTVQLLRYQEVAESLSMSRRGVYNLVQRGLLHPIYVDSDPRFDVADVAALIERKRQESAS